MKKHTNKLIYAVAVVAVIFGYVNLPKKVTAMEQEIQRNQQHLGNLTQTVDKYVATQAIKEEADKEYRKLLMEWIKEMKEK